MPSLLLGLDLGATATKAVLTDAAGTLLDSARWASQPDDAAPLDHCLIQVAMLLGERRPDAIGIAICGLIAPDGSTMLHAPNARRLEGLPWRAAFADTYPAVPIALLNDAKAFVYAEHLHGAAQDYRHVLGVTLGTGIGGGFILDGALYLGAHGWLGEIGHIPLDPAGPPCLCGLTGCLEASLGEAALCRDYNTSLTDPRQRTDSGAQLIERASLGDPTALALWERAGTLLGAGLHGPVTLLDLELVVLGGGLAAAFPYFEETLRDELERTLSRSAERDLAVVPAVCGRDAGALGAAWWAASQSAGSS